MYRHTASDFSGAVAVSSWQTATSFNDTSATASILYWYWVKAATSADPDIPASILHDVRDRRASELDRLARVERVANEALRFGIEPIDPGPRPYPERVRGVFE